MQGRVSLAVSTVLNINISMIIWNSINTSNTNTKKSTISIQVLMSASYLRMEVETGSLGPVWKKMMK